jgi:hypothetical protein
MATSKKPSKKPPVKKAKKPKAPVVKKVKSSPKAKVAKAAVAPGVARRQRAANGGAAKSAKTKAAKTVIEKPAPVVKPPEAKTVVVKELPKEELKRKIVALLKESGDAGAHIKTIAEKTGRTINGIYVFFSTTAKNIASIIKVAPATYALRPEKSDKKS